MKNVRRSKIDPLAFEGVSSDPRNQIVADWLLKYGIQRLSLVTNQGDSPAVCGTIHRGRILLC